ncbi:Monofunctional riboflavin biosynthesis protein RIBA 3- chloroplastic [Striga hermonthica]|uniref:3,4-dihydroxy-2-butanone 4-phosphate synthase n=1 Tax=Striga hermonthica TaxID=68872 RepID=A0A9N7MN46_STRHE|nr:Monofunctional riboflavin biosynthesis protein RIBA 3- chloroplastic [Striga hermonthica]
MDCIVFQHSFFLKPSNTSLNLTHQLGSTSRIRAWKFGTCCGNQNVNGSLLFDQSSSSPLPPFGTLETEITNETIDFFVSDAEDDPDRPSPGYSPIEQALNALRQEKFVMVVDEDEIGNVEGSLVMGACHTSEKRIGFMVGHGSGIVSVGMKGEDLERLKLPLMSPENEDDSSAPSFTITVDAKVGTTTGVSASDRANTVLALASPKSRPKDFKRPGHVFPLKYRNGGVLRRVGHTEASVDLVTLAGLRPVSVVTSVVDFEDGSLASVAYLKKLASDHNLPIVSITDLIRYRRKREKLVERIAISQFPTKWGTFHVHCYRSKLDGMEHMAIVKVKL